jgi:hypothetical protein
MEIALGNGDSASEARFTAPLDLIGAIFSPAPLIISLARQTI